MKGFIQNIEKIAMTNQDFSASALHGQELPTRCHVTEAQRGDWDGST